MRNRTFPLLFVLSLLAAPALAGQPSWLARGPVLGSLSPSGITIWIQSAVPVTVRAVVTPEGGDTGITTAPVTLAAGSDLIGTLTVHGLTPGTRYTYRLEAQGFPPLEGKNGGWSFRTPPPNGHPTRLILTAGSGANNWAVDHPDTWKAMARLHPDLFLALGDTPYADELMWHESRRWRRAFAAWKADPTPQRKAFLDGVTAQYRAVASSAIPLAYHFFRDARGWPAFAASTVLAATWDDHDTGLNDSDTSNPVVDIALANFRRYTPNPSFGLPDAPGTFWIERYGDVEIYLLDDETYRTPTDEALADPSHATLLGAAQLHWLIRSLAASTATFKILACGSPFNDTPRKKDAWATYPVERQRLMDAIVRHRVGGVVLLSGDIHRSELYRLPWLEEKGGYPLWEFIPSPLFQHGRPCGVAIPERQFCARVPDRSILQLFGVLRIDTTLPDPELVLQLHDTAGNVLMNKRLTASQLQFR
jgi:alkaline phosphatase D